MNTSFIYYLLLLLTVVLLVPVGCKQSDWLEQKRLTSDVQPETVKDFQAILDNTSWINNRFISSALAATDNLYVTDRDYPSLLERERRIYAWQNDPWGTDGSSTMEWRYPFAIIEYANIVLDGLGSGQSFPEADNIKGQALFLRAYAYYNLCVLFCEQYEGTNAASKKGLPIRLTSDATQLFQRSTLSETFDQVISDAKAASELLPKNQLLWTRPSSLAAFGLLAKTYLLMGQYELALEQANRVLSEKPSLLDFNDPKISLSQTYRFPADGKDNEEILFYAYGGNLSIIRPTTNTRGNVDTLLYQLYDDNDLRKAYFYFNNGSAIKFRGSYTGNFYTFNGIATNEIYLIKAECEVRLGLADQAIATLNLLLEKRYLAGSFLPKVAGTANETLQIILQERRKELPFTFNTRWEDLKRLNLEAEHAVTVRRMINGQQYELTPGDKRYALPIPQAEIDLSGIEQNDY